MSQFGKGRKSMQRRLILEQLEVRSVLSGCSMLGSAHTHAFEHATVHTDNPTIQGISSASASAAESGETHLTATLASATAGSTATGSVNFESETEDGSTQTRFSVSVQGAAASTTLDVAITDAANNKVVVGQITTDASGNGKLVLSSEGGDSSSTLPANFPAVVAGSIVSVGTDLSGTLATAPAGDHGGCHHGDSGETEGSETRLTAALVDATGASPITGTAKYKSEQEEDGTTVTSFRVNVQGATAGETLDVAIDGTSVGTITADSSGKGTLFLSSNTNNPKATPLPANFPTVNAGSVITINGIVMGTLGAPSAQTSHAHFFSRRH